MYIDKKEMTTLISFELSKTPPSANSSWKFKRCGKGNVYLSDETVEFRKQIKDVVNEQAAVTEWKRQATATIHICPMRRRYDADNACKPILDALEEAGLLADDNCITTLIATKCLCRKCKVRTKCTIVSHPELPFPPIDDAVALEKECERKRKKGEEKRQKRKREEES